VSTGDRWIVRILKSGDPLRREGDEVRRSLGSWRR